MSITTHPSPRATTRRVEERSERSSTPAWASIAAWGAGLVEIALSATALTTGSVPIGVALVGIGAASLAWGVATLAHGRVILPRTAIAGSLAGIVAAVVALVADTARIGILPVAVAAALFFAIALAGAREHRRGSDATPPRLAVLFVAAVVVAALITPALGATEAGRLAPDHGSHGITDPGHHGG